MTVTSTESAAALANTVGLPRLGFLGVGWIGRHRMQAVADSGVAEVAAVADASDQMLSQAVKCAPEAIAGHSLDDLLRCSVDGLVIATPSAMHAEQTVAALERGVAVFCQKPLARTPEETRWVLGAARRADRLLGVDLSYRHVAGAEAMRRMIRGGEIGEVYAADLTFHNAYGPDKPWFYDRTLSGGGCAIDLGTHLVDLALWMLDFPAVNEVTSRVFAGGRPLGRPVEEVEDYAIAQLDLAGGAVARLACSWRLQAGCDAVIEAAFYGTKGGVALRNVNGSFYDFTVDRFHGTSRQRLASPPDEWGGRAVVAWARQLAENAGYDPSADHLQQTADVLGAIYA